MTENILINGYEPYAVSRETENGCEYGLPYFRAGRKVINTDISDKVYEKLLLEYGHEKMIDSYYIARAIVFILSEAKVNKKNIEETEKKLNELLKKNWKLIYDNV